MDRISHSLPASAYRRSAILMGHIVVPTSPFRLNPTNSDEKENSIDSVQDFAMREYIVGKDDAAFKALDYLCCQGVKTKLYSEFLLKLAFETIQPKGWCCVAEDYKGDMIGIARSYIYQASVNGEFAPISYAFLTRVHPHYRRKNLAVRLIAQLFMHDIQDADVEYMTSWVVADNISSLTLQERIQTEAAVKHGMPKPDSIGTFRCLGISIDDMITMTIPSVPLHFTKISAAEQQEQSKALFSSHQFYPADIDALVTFELNLGAYVMKDNEGKLIAMINVWNSGEVRISCMRDSNFRGDGAVLLYNPWYEKTERGNAALEKLTDLAVRDLASQGFKFVNIFFPMEYPALGLFEEFAKIDVTWMARVWYVSNHNKIDMKRFPNIFYDPRECLV